MNSTRSIPTHNTFILRCFFCVASAGIFFLGFGQWMEFPGQNPSMHQARKLNPKMNQQRNHPELTENTEAKSEWDLMRLRDPATGTLPLNMHARELAFASTLPSTSANSSTNYKSFGDALQSAGTEWKSVGPTNVGGRTQAIVFDASNENNLLAAAAQGGVWRSTDRGASWNITTSPTQLHDAMSLVQDTRAGKQNVWYYGTGELLSTTLRRVSVVVPPRWRTQDIGDGIYKSIDSGKTWNILSSTVSGPTTQLTQPFNGVWTLVTNNHDLTHDMVYAAGYGAIMRSSDGGTTWANVLGDSKNPSYCTDITISSQGILYAAMSTETLTGTISSTAGIWRSIDGIRWKQINPATGWPVETRRIKLALAPSNENVLYTVLESPGATPSDHSVFKYTFASGDGSGSGGTWEDRSQSLPYDASNSTAVGNFNSLGGYALIIKVKPDNENMVFIGGTDLYSSKDGFATSSSVNWIGGYNADPNASYVEHPDHHAIAFLPSDPNTIFTGNDGGVYTAPDDTDLTTLNWQSQNTGFVTTMFYSVAMDHAASGDTLLVGGLQDNWSWAGWDTANNWVSLNGGDGCYSGVSDGAHYLYTSSQFASIERYSLDAQQNVADYSYVAPYDASFTFVAPWLLDPSNTDRMYLAGGRMLWRNNDLAGIPAGNNNYTTQNWDQLTTSAIPSSGANDTSVIGCVSVSTIPTNRVYFGTSDGRLFRIDNANNGNPAAREITNAIFPKNAFIANVAVDPENADNIIAVFSNYNVISLFASSNGGSTWRNISGNLDQNVDGTGDGPSCRWAAIIHRGLSTFYYVGTSVGLYSTTDISSASPIWSQEGTNTIGNFTVEMIDFRETDGQIAIATQGHGVFIATAPSAVFAQPIATLNDRLGTNYPNPSSGTTTIPFELATEERVSLSLIDESGKPVRQIFEGLLTAGNHVLTLDTHGLAEGAYFYRLGSPGGLQTRRLTVMR